MRYSKFYKLLLSFDDRHRYFYTFFLLVLLIGLWLLLWHIPMQKTIEYEHNRLTQLLVDKEKLVVEKGACKRLADQLRITEQDCIRFDDKISDAELMAACMECATQVGLHINTLRIGDAKQKDTKKTIFFPIEATGSLAQVMRFFQEIADKKLGLEANVCSLQRQTGATYVLRGLLKRIVVACGESFDKQGLEAKKSPSTLKKAEGLGG